MNIALYIVLILALACAGAFLAHAVLRRRRPRAAAVTASAGIAAGLSSGLRRLLSGGEMGDAFWAELERTLIEADAGVDVTQRLIEAARGGSSAEVVRDTLSERMCSLFPGAPEISAARPRVVLVVGANGVGKTTTIAKLARRRIARGERVLLTAADTFRAAAVEQLKEWGARLGCEVVAQGQGADPAAVAYDGCERARAKGYDAVIIDTAGRLHNKGNLMEELAKISRVIGRAVPGAPHEKLVVIDATVGGNGLAQAREFNAAIGLTGAVVTKLDGTAKGGVLLAIAGELGIPVADVGVGEGLDDLRPFDAAEYVSAILGGERPALSRPASRPLR